MKQIGGGPEIMAKSFSAVHMKSSSWLRYAISLARVWELLVPSVKKKQFAPFAALEFFLLVVRLEVCQLKRKTVSTLH